METFVVALILVFILRWVYRAIRACIRAGREIDAALVELEIGLRVDEALLESRIDGLVAEIEDHLRRAADDRT